MKVSLRATVDLALPDASDPSLQNIYFFNLYRSGSSVMEAVALALAAETGRAPVNIMQSLYDMGVEYDVADQRGNSRVYLSEPSDLDQFARFGGYLIYGFREIPQGYAEAFEHRGAAILMVRDPRDIAISHYHAIKKHSQDNLVTSKHIQGALKKAEEQSLEDYILSPDMLRFIRRICVNYAPLIRGGLKPVHYEDLFDETGFSTRLLCDAVLAETGDYLGGGIDAATLYARTQKFAEDSVALKGHATSGGTRGFMALDPDVRNELTAKLEDCLHLLNYEL